MKIATFNVNSVRTRLEILARWLEKCPVDVLCLQETKVADEQFPLLEIRRMGYECVYHGEKSYNGVAILSKEPLENVSFGFPGGKPLPHGGNPLSHGGTPPLFPTRVVQAEYRGVKILNTYVPQGKEITHADYQTKLAFLDMVKIFIDENMKEKFLWLGDMNVAPTEIDLTNPKTNKENVCFYLPLREHFAKISGDMIDVFRKFHPEPGHYSFYSYLTKNSLERKIGWRVDHIFATPALAERAINCEIDTAQRTWERPSDHVPVIAEFL